MCRGPLQIAYKVRGIPSFMPPVRLCKKEFRLYPTIILLLVFKSSNFGQPLFDGNFTRTPEEATTYKLPVYYDYNVNPMEIFIVILIKVCVVCESMYLGLLNIACVCKFTYFGLLNIACVSEFMYFELLNIASVSEFMYFELLNIARVCEFMYFGQLNIACVCEFMYFELLNIACVCEFMYFELLNIARVCEFMYLGLLNIAFICEFVYRGLLNYCPKTLHRLTIIKMPFPRNDDWIKSVYVFSISLEISSASLISFPVYDDTLIRP